MKKIIFTTTILVLFVSCTVAKNGKSEYSSYQPAIENSTQSVGQKSVQTGKSKESKTEKNTVSTTTQVQKNTYYNPFRYREEWKTERERTAVEVRQTFLSNECDALALQTLIEKYNTTKDIQVLYALCEYNCTGFIDFALDLINTSSDEGARKIAIGALGFRKYYEVIPLLLNLVKKEGTSSEEKIKIAETLDVLDRKTEALDIFNCNCYTLDYMESACVTYYFYLSEDRTTGFKYFNYFLNKPQTRVEAASYLAKLGVEDKTFTVFEEFLKNNTIYQPETDIALLGLASIGTEKSFELLKIMTQSENGMIAKRAQEIYKNYYIERK